MAVTFDDIGQRADPLLTHHWECEHLPSFSGTSLPARYVETVDLPMPELDVKEGIFGAGTFTYLPGYESFPAFNLSIYEDNSARALKYLNKWREAIREPSTGLYHLPHNYKKTITLGLYNAQGQKVLTVKLFNCWPTSISELRLTGEDAERVVHQVNMSCDGSELIF